MKIGEAVKLISSSLENMYDEREAKNIAYLLLGHILGISKVKIISLHDEVVESGVEKIILRSLKELLTHKPVQHILGSTLFCDCRIKVSKDVLIPRPETEELVHLIINDQKGKPEKIKIFDLCTGSACIAVALKKNLPDSEVHAADISKPALLLAKENARNNDTRIIFHHFNVLDPLNWHSVNDFDIIVSNPPYVRESEKRLMKKNVLDHEPALALFVPDDAPLKFYKALLQFADRYLVSGGRLYFEINEALADATAGIYKKQGYHDVFIKTDFNDRQRFLSCVKP